jgi:hypothetical protein
MRYVNRLLVKNTLAAGALLLILGSQACAPTIPRTDTTDPDAVILRSELESRPFPSLFQAIRALRPSWLRNPGGVYVNEVASSVRGLRERQVSEVERVELVPYREAWTRWNIAFEAVPSDFIHVIRRRTH